MKRAWVIPVVAGFAVVLTSCVGYGYPGTGSGYGTGYPPPGGGYGNPDYGNPAYGNPGYGSTIRCESNDNRTQYCSADTRGGVRLSRQISGSSCIQGRTWGYEQNRIWVSQGCRAEFITGSGGGNGPGYGNPGYGNGQVVRCESQDGRQRRCNVRVGGGVQLSKQLSNTRCIEGRNWGWDRSGIWVNGGCRGEFRVY